MLNNVIAKKILSEKFCSMENYHYLCSVKRKIRARVKSWSIVSFTAYFL